MEHVSIEDFVNQYGSSRGNLVFRGQGSDHPTILASVYRELWPYRDRLPAGDAIAASIDSGESLEVDDFETAQALVLWKVRVDRYFRFGFPLTRLMELFFPDDLELVRQPEWKGTLGHLMAVHQHAGFKTTQLDWTWDPLVAAWFATHEPSSTGWRSRQQGIVYVLNVSRVHGRLRDLALVPNAFPRPHQQRGLTIPSGWLEDFKACIQATLFIDAGIGHRLFEASGITAQKLFPDSEDPVHDLYHYWLANGHDLPWLIDWITSNRDSALGRLFLKNRKKVITRLCKIYDAFWVRKQDGIQLLPQWCSFDMLKLSGQKPETQEWDVMEADPWFSSADTWGTPSPHAFATEEDEFNTVLARLVAPCNGRTVIEWGRDK